MMATSGRWARTLRSEVVAVAGLADHLDAGLLEQPDHGGPHQQRVLGDHDAHGHPPPRPRGSL